MTLPLKTYYTIDEAVNLFHQLYPQRVDIDESYFFQLGSKGYIRLGIFNNTSNIDDIGLGTLDFDYYEGTEDTQLLIKHIIAIVSCLIACSSHAVILILNETDVLDLYWKNNKSLSDLMFDNVFSLERSRFLIEDEMVKDLFLFKYTDKLTMFDLYENIFYSKSRGEVHYMLNEEDGNHYMPDHDDDGFEDDWKFSYWFKQSATKFTDEEKFSDRIIKKEECLIFGEDLQLLIDGKHRESVETAQRDTKNKAPQLDGVQGKVHPKRTNSINKIVYALAKMADLDLSQHQSAYTQLEAFCAQQNIAIPGKDTSGNLFKEIHRAFNSKNSI